jgi:hypothetical protein
MRGRGQCAEAHLYRGSAWQQSAPCVSLVPAPPYIFMV